MNTKKINELTILEQATAETNVLVEQNGTASRIPAAALEIKDIVKFTAQELKPEQQTQARQNIGAVSQEELSKAMESIPSGGASEKEIIEKLALPLQKSGERITCYPVEGYPLKVVSKFYGDMEEGYIPSMTLTFETARKNLLPYPCKQLDQHQDWEEWDGVDPFYNGLRQNTDGSFSISTGWCDDYVGALIADKDSLGLIPGKQYTLSARVVSGTMDNWGGESNPTLTLHYYPKDSTTTKKWLSVSFTDGVASVTGVCPEDFESAYCYLNLYRDISYDGVTIQVQLEEGAVATDYEPCVTREVKTYTVDFEAHDCAYAFWDTQFMDTYDWSTGVLDVALEGVFNLPPQEISPLSGKQTIYCDRGTIEIVGLENPAAVIAGQEVRIAALEAALLNG